MKTRTRSRSRARALAALVALAGGPGCARAPECDAVCAPAADRFEGCLAEWGLAWGLTAGYDDRDDYRNWCETWVMEQRALAAAEDDPAAAAAALGARCEDLAAAMEAGTCEDYYPAWEAAGGE